MKANRAGLLTVEANPETSKSLMSANLRQLMLEREVTISRLMELDHAIWEPEELLRTAGP